MRESGESEEAMEGADGVEMVGHGSGFAAGVHGPLWCAHVNSAKLNLRSENVSEG